MKQKSINQQQKYEPLKFKVRLQRLWNTFQKANFMVKHWVKVQIRSSARTIIGYSKTEKNFIKVIVANSIFIHLFIVSDKSGLMIQVQKK